MKRGQKKRKETSSQQVSLLLPPPKKSHKKYARKRHTTYSLRRSSIPFSSLGKGDDLRPKRLSSAFDFDDGREEDEDEDEDEDDDDWRRRRRRRRREEVSERSSFDEDETLESRPARSARRKVAGAADGFFFSSRSKKRSRFVGRRVNG